MEAASSSIYSKEAISSAKVKGSFGSELQGSIGIRNKIIVYCINYPPGVALRSILLILYRIHAYKTSVFYYSGGQLRIIKAHFL